MDGFYGGTEGTLANCRQEPDWFRSVRMTTVFDGSRHTKNRIPAINNFDRTRGRAAPRVLACSLAVRELGDCCAG
jgi:hypothetical protein